jgi:DNA-binding response OmpR family regulator
MNMHPVLSLHRLNIDPNNFQVRCENKKVILTKKEFQLLEFMAMNRDRVLNRLTLLEHVWHYGTFAATNTLDAHIASLRRKLDKGRHKKLIRTIHGIGFLFSDTK